MLDNILFFFAALGVFNAFILSMYLIFFKKNQVAHEVYLGILLLLLSIRIGVSCFYYFGPVPVPAIKIGLIANLLLGPTVWAFALLSPTSHNKTLRKYTVHLIAVIMLSGMLWVLFDFKLWDYTIRYAMHTVLLFYLIAAGILLRKDIKTLISKSTHTSEYPFKAQIYFALLAVCLGFAVSLSTTYILGPLVFSVILYWTFGYLVLNTSKKRKSYNKEIDESLFKSVNKRLIEIMESERLYRDADLNLELLASRLGVSKHFLSQMLNHNLKRTFHQFINEYRIKEACHLLLEKTPYSVEAIGYEVGFRSKSAFFATFKRFNGTTPSKYKDLN